MVTPMHNEEEGKLYIYFFCNNEKFSKAMKMDKPLDEFVTEGNQLIKAAWNTYKTLEDKQK